jgi:hypothetical protein
MFWSWGVYLVRPRSESLSGEVVSIDDKGGGWW